MPTTVTCPVPPQCLSTRRLEPSRSCAEVLLFPLGVNQTWKCNGSSQSEEVWHTFRIITSLEPFITSPLSANQFWGEVKGRVKKPTCAQQQHQPWGWNRQGYPSFVFMWAGALNPGWSQEMVVRIIWMLSNVGNSRGARQVRAGQD